MAIYRDYIIDKIIIREDVRNINISNKYQVSITLNSSSTITNTCT